MKKILFFFALLNYPSLQAQNINPYLFGQNANLTDTVGTDTTVNGKLDLYWQSTGPRSTQNFIAESKTNIMRYGGILVEQDCNIDGTPGTGSNIDKTIHDYIRKAIVMEKNGIMPMLTLPLKISGSIPTIGAAAKQAKLLVKNVNDTLQSLSPTYKPVVHWIYSNEPEDGGGLHLYDDSAAAQNIHSYIKAYHDSVMTIWNSSWNGSYSGPQFVGPELYSFDNYSHGAGKVNRLIEQLCGRYNQLGGSASAFDIRPYLSVFSFHYYPFNNEDTLNSDILAPDRNNVINALASGDTVPAGYRTKPLKENLDSLKIWLGSYYPSVQIGITEANICNVDDVDGSYVTDDSVNGQGANSFIAGQFWAEMMEICMAEDVSHLNFWSAIEGCASCTHPNYETNIGFLNTNPATGSVGDKKSTFYHFKMIADNMAGRDYAAGSTSATNLKVFGAHNCTGVVAMLMNQNTSGSISFEMHLDSSSFTPASGESVNIDAGIRRSYIGSIGAKESLLLTFDACGKLVGSQRYSEADNLTGAPPTETDVTYRVRCEKCSMKEWLSFPECKEEEMLRDPIIMPDTTITGSYEVNAIWYVPKHVTLVIDSAALLFQPNAYIDVAPEGHIIIHDSWLKSCEGSAWKGIRIRGSVDTSQQVNIQRSIIEDADTTLRLRTQHNIVLNENTFSNGLITILADSCKGLHVTKNDFSEFDKEIVTHYNVQDYSEITENLFADVSSAVSFQNSDHQKLTMTCNTFYNYAHYAINSSSSLLANFGDSLEGAGNQFITYSVDTNHRLLHDGNSIKYWCDPSDPFTLVKDSFKKVTADTALDDGCKEEHKYVPLMQAINTNQSEHSSAITATIPNPAKDQIGINYVLAKGTQNAALILQNVYGESIRTLQLNVSATSQHMDLSGLNSGIYFISLETNGRRIETKKIMILN
ncbi:MAG: T9SS type A sorting domain-containing protein [Bacteroidia bacterium]